VNIQYTLVENRLTEDPDTFVARVRPRGTADLDYIIKHIVKKGSTVVAADILSVLEDYHEVVETLLQEGMNVVTPTANYRTSIRGLFDGRADGFDPSRHRVVVRLSPGVRLRRAMHNGLQVGRVYQYMPHPMLLDFVDVVSGARNSTVTPGGHGKLFGRLLRFDAEDPEQGVFFVAVDDSATRVEVVPENMPGKLIFLNPSLAAGAYRLQVRAALNGEEVRIGTLAEVLTVA